MSFKLTDFITVTGTGNVGINNTIPSSFFGNASQLVIGDGSTSRGMTIYSDTNTDGQIFFADGITGADQYKGIIRYEHSSDALVFWTNATEKMRISSSGNVGIGGTPSYTLHVSGNVIAVEDSVPAFRLIGSTTSFDLKSDGGVFKVRDVSGGNELYHIAAGASGYHKWYINDSLKMILDSSGNVGIGSGTNTLVYPLEVYGGNGDAILFKDTTNSVTNWFGAFGGAAVVGALTAGDDLALYAGGGEKMRISSGGNADFSEYVRVKGDTAAPATGVGVEMSYNSVSNRGQIGVYDRGNSVYKQVYFYGSDYVFDVGGAPKITITSGGNVGIGTTTLDANANLTVFGNYRTDFIRDYYGGNRAYILRFGANTASSGHVIGSQIVASLASDDVNGSLEFYTKNAGNLENQLTITSTGAIAVGSSSTNYGSSGQVLTSNGNASPSWTSASGAKGEPGGTGAQGTAGSNGSNGAQGTAGTNGSNGALGSQGTNGSTGAQGAVGLNGGTGGQGTTGATGGGGGTGVQGTAGSNGSNGGTGAQGTTGTTGGGGGTGAQGTTGSNGGTGAQGTAGSNGSNGSNGNNGAQGTTGTTGNTGNTGGTGGTGGTGPQGTSGVNTFPYTTGDWATFANNVAGDAWPSTEGLTVGWNESNGSQETILFFRGNSSSGYKKLQFVAGAYASQSYYRKQVFEMTSTRIYCGTGGNLPISANAFTNTSDYRLKENIILLTGALARVLQLKPSRFNFIDKPNVTIDGFIAHEVLSVVPEAVDGVKDDVERWEEMDVTPDGEAPVGASVGDPKLDENGNEIPYYQGVDLSKMVPILTAAIQEQQVLINNLTARIEALEG